MEWGKKTEEEEYGRKERRQRKRSTWGRERERHEELEQKITELFWRCEKKKEKIETEVSENKKTSESHNDVKLDSNKNGESILITQIYVEVDEVNVINKNVTNDRNEISHMWSSSD